MEQPPGIFIKSRIWIAVLIILVIVGLLSYFGAITNPQWLGDFSANLAADTLVAIVVGLVITMYFQSSRETAQRQTKQREAYELLKEELEEDLQALGDLRKAWLENKLLLFNFQTGRGETILQDGAILGEDLELISLVYNTYEEMEFFNRYYSILLEEPIRLGKLELSVGLPRTQLKDDVDKHLDRLRTLITKTLQVIS